MMKICTELHQLFNKLQRFRFPFQVSQIPTNGIYILFEAGERAPLLKKNHSIRFEKIDFENFGSFAPSW